MDINNILLNLEIIKQIKEGDKLAINILPGSTKLFVDNVNFFSGPRRWYNGYNRENNIRFIEELVNNIESTSEIIINGNHNELAINLKNSIKSSITGLNNLQYTYSNDSITIAKLTLVINRLTKIITNLENIEDNISMTILNNIENNIQNNIQNINHNNHHNNHDNINHNNHDNINHNNHDNINHNSHENSDKNSHEISHENNDENSNKNKNKNKDKNSI